MQMWLNDGSATSKDCKKAAPAIRWQCLRTLSNSPRLHHLWISEELSSGVKLNSLDNIGRFGLRDLHWNAACAVLFRLLDYFRLWFSKFFTTKKLLHPCKVICVRMTVLRNGSISIRPKKEHKRPGKNNKALNSKEMRRIATRASKWVGDYLYKSENETRTAARTGQIHETIARAWIYKINGRRLYVLHAKVACGRCKAYKSRRTQRMWEAANHHKHLLSPPDSPELHSYYGRRVGMNGLRMQEEMRDDGN